MAAGETVGINSRTSISAGNFSSSPFVMYPHTQTRRKPALSNGYDIRLLRNCLSRDLKVPGSSPGVGFAFLPTCTLLPSWCLSPPGLGFGQREWVGVCKGVKQSNEHNVIKAVALQKRQTSNESRLIWREDPRSLWMHIRCPTYLVRPHAPDHKKTSTA
jgi:hypothetical protein